ncbi:hypothetical protein [Streptomonospora litoralis]|uniref:Uncharacterized protein n=1 Tax=Streptomonospora litoralis TaxID=2498135 RepID=A0A4V0ZKF9_9ACTN|nr:hypothetical protein [Streptomonospora litoralis]QBI56842.1 hypothetical protein EKD16_25510 [Streptomonospora litoralis]
MTPRNSGDESLAPATDGFKRYGPVDDESTVVVLVTALGHPRFGHTVPVTLALRARAYGLTATHTHDGRLLLRTHSLDLTGPLHARKRFARACNRYTSAANRPQLRRRRSRDEVRRLLADLPATAPTGARE